MAGGAETERWAIFGCRILVVFRVRVLVTVRGRSHKQLESVEEAGLNVLNGNTDGFGIRGAKNHADNSSLRIDDRRARVTNACNLCRNQQPGEGSGSGIESDRSLPINLFYGSRSGVIGSDIARNFFAGLKAAAKANGQIAGNQRNADES